MHTYLLTYRYKRILILLLPCLFAYLVTYKYTYLLTYLLTYDPAVSHFT